MIIPNIWENKKCSKPPTRYNDASPLSPWLRLRASQEFTPKRTWGWIWRYCQVMHVMDDHTFWHSQGDHWGYPGFWPPPKQIAKLTRITGWTYDYGSNPWCACLVMFIPPKEISEVHPSLCQNPRSANNSSLWFINPEWILVLPLR